MSTVDSALNCSATVLLIDFAKRFFKPDMSERASLLFLRLTTVLWGVLGTLVALLMLGVDSALDVWWQVSGIFGGGILGLFLLSLLRIRLKLWQGLASVGVSTVVILWGTLARDLPESLSWAECPIDRVLVGAVGAGALMLAALLFGLINRQSTPRPGARRN
jgi:SSS family solute:Na+ symporter